ncbi:unnamed protein product [Paramecium primaurelia]|uniref:Protein kinase domain-containing protein n=1 Tax=Paramecium primaurelia TaxID=5886 RepID=A0A8S1NF64_PARPR|nr:unnamed protein product [Paramecium primaurelia]
MVVLLLYILLRRNQMVLKWLLRHFLRKCQYKRIQIHGDQQQKMRQRQQNHQIIKVFLNFMITLKIGLNHIFLMSLARGGTHEQGLKKLEEPLPFLTVKVIFRQIVDAIKYIHQRGFIHRDLKPSNIQLKKPMALKYIMKNVRITNKPLFNAYNQIALKQLNKECNFDWNKINEELYNSRQLTHLLKKMLSIDQNKRPTCSDILKTKILDVEYDNEGCPLFINYKNPKSQSIQQVKTSRPSIKSIRNNRLPLVSSNLYYNIQQHKNPQTKRS